MGGQCAEEIFFGDVSTGPGGDLLSATRRGLPDDRPAGMGEHAVSPRRSSNSASSGTNIVGRVLGDDEGPPRVEELLQARRARPPGALGANRHLVEALRDALLERDELIGDEIPRSSRPPAGAPVYGSTSGSGGGRSRPRRTHQLA